MMIMMVVMKMMLMVVMIMMNRYLMMGKCSEKLKRKTVRIPDSNKKKDETENWLADVDPALVQ